MRFWVLPVTLLFAAGLADVNGVGEPSGHPTKDTLDKLAIAAGQYRERLSHIPLRETVTQARYDVSGKLVEQQVRSYEYFFLGLDPATDKVRELRRGGGTAEDQGGIRIIGVGLTGLLRVLEPDVQPEYNLAVSEGQGKLVTVSFEPKTWDPPQVSGSLSDLHLSGRIRGTITVDSRDASFLALNSELLGLPAERRRWFKKFTLYRLAIDVSFQRIPRVGWAEPLVVPESIRVTADSSEGKIVVLHKYELLERDR